MSAYVPDTDACLNCWQNTCDGCPYVKEEVDLEQYYAAIKQAVIESPESFNLDECGVSFENSDNTKSLWPRQISVTFAETGATVIFKDLPTAMWWMERMK